MNNYFVQYRLHTLARVWGDLKNRPASFEFEGVKFSHWDFDEVYRQKTYYWLLEEKIDAIDLKDVILKFNTKITTLIPQIAFLSQCYSEYLNEPYLVKKEGSDVAFFRYTRSSAGVPLAFDASSLKALELMNNNQGINSEFFFYWNDMLNVTGYSAKLLLLCSALEVLVKSSVNSRGIKGKYDFLTEVLGEELKNKIFEQNLGIRHRLTHGEYFKGETDKENYLNEVYERVISYFNDKIFKEQLIRHVTNPQRHPEGNKKGGHYFLKKKHNSPEFDLKNLVKGCDEDFDKGLQQFDLIPLPQNY